MRCVLLFLALLSVSATAADWPMWRFDAGRTAASGEHLPAKLHLQWERVETPREQVWDDPLNHDLMPYDKVFEPVVMGGRMFIGFNDQDKLVALDLESGAVVWTFFTGGPVRLPPVCWEGKVYFTSDDGHLYCVNAEDGRKVWAFRAAPSARKALGNSRLISAWPARGGPVIEEGRVYFAASIWPFMGTYLYALEAASGQVVWVNDGTGANFIKQPHSASAFAGVAPQGALVISGNTLLVPGGRSVPAGFERETGEMRYFHLKDGAKGNGGSFVAAGAKSFYVHTRERGVRGYDLESGKAGESTMNEPVIAGDRLYAAAVSEGGDPVVRALDTSDQVLWEVKADGSGDLILAGTHLYAAGKSSLSAIALPEAESGQPRVAWTLPVRGEIQRLLAANGKLVAVTQDGRIQVYGTGKVASHIEPKREHAPEPPVKAVKLARSLLKLAADAGGHCLMFGTDGSGLLEALLRESKMQITVVEPDIEKVDVLRQRYDKRGEQGRRITFHAGDALSFQAPPYFAHLVIVSPEVLPLLRQPEMLRAAYASVRPYGGVMVWPDLGKVDLSGLENAKATVAGRHQIIVREGALPGAADWTHQYGDIGNTVKSDDSRVRAPLGLLWFGGSSNMDVLPRHGHGPPEQVVGGRLFIQGMNSFSARDVYTGRVIWKHDFEDLGTYGIYYDESYVDAPLSTAYNQRHFAGANGRGTNYAATEESVYVAVHGECQVLDSRSGKLKKTIKLRQKADEPAQWAFIGVLDDLLIGGDDYAHFSLKAGSVESRSAAPIEDYSASAGLAVFDRHDGRLIWRVKARYSFLHNGIVAGNGRIYCLDKLTSHAEGILDRRGRDLPQDYRMVAFDARTGAVVWEQKQDVFGTWLGYSAEHDVLLQAGAKASDRLSSEVGEGMIAYAGKGGGVLWQDRKRSYSGPCILHNELILTGANSYSSSGGAFSLLTGKPHLVENPLTGKIEPWRLNRTYGCNTIIASEHLLTFRSGAAGFYDLESMSGTASLGGFKSGCTSNLVVANGVLNAPDYTRTCSCSYQNQTSLAFIHMPDMEMWSYSQFGLDGKHGDRIVRAGINFGAPGNRRAPDSTLWLEHPHAGEGNAPQMGVEGIGPEVKWFRRHSLQKGGEGPSHPWITASGLVGASEIVITPSLRRPLMVKPAKATKDENGNVIPPPPPPTQEPLLRVDYPPLPHTVRLHFSEPDNLPPGARVFTVLLQGKPVLENFDIARECASSGGAVVREFPGVSIASDLRVTLQAVPGSKAPPVLCGVEFAAD